MRAAMLLLALMGVAQGGPEPPLCRVEATYRPVSWAVWLPPEERLRTITVRLRPGCEGRAYITLYNRASGRLWPADGGYQVLTKASPIFRFPPTPPGAVGMNTWEVRWHAVSGKPYTVPQERK